MSSLPPGHDGVPPSRPADVSASVASASSSTTAAASTSAPSPPVAAPAASSAAPSATASSPAASASASRASSSGGSRLPPAPSATPAPPVPGAAHNPAAMAADADAALPVGTDHDAALWYQDLFAPYFWSRLSDDVWSRLTGDVVPYLPPEWDMIISLLRPSGIAPGPVARPTSPLTLPASDNPARFVGLADALYADQSDSDALWRIGEVVRMPGSPYGTHPIARGIIVGHNFLVPVYGRSERDTLDFLLPFPEYRFYHVLTYFIGSGGALTAHIVEWVPQSSLDYDAEATTLLHDPPTITPARPFHPTPPVPDRSVSDSRVEGIDGPPDDWSQVSASSPAASPAPAPASSVNVPSSASSQSASVAASSLGGASTRPPRASPSSPSRSSVPALHLSSKQKGPRCCCHPMS